MIYTMWGSEVKIVDYFPESSTVAIKRESDGQEFVCQILELKADGGLNEIEEAIKQL